MSPRRPYQSRDWAETDPLRLISSLPAYDYVNVWRLHLAEQHAVKVLPWSIYVVVVVVVVAFSSHAKSLEESWSDRSTPALFEINSHIPIPFLCQDQSTVAQRAEKTVDECSLTRFVGARFPGRFPHYMPEQHNQPTPTSLDQGCIRL